MQICGYRDQPETALGIDVGSEANESRSTYSASWAQIQAGSVKQPSKIEALEFRSYAADETP